MPFQKGNKFSKGGKPKNHGGRPTKEKKDTELRAQQIAHAYIEKHIKPVLRAYGKLSFGRWVWHYNQQTGEKLYKEFEVDPTTVRHFIDKLLPAAKTTMAMELTGSLPDEIFQAILAAKNATKTIPIVFAGSRKSLVLHQLYKIKRRRNLI
jgi:hypothetical protein